MPKHRDLLARDPPLAEKDEDENLGGSSSQEMEEKSEGSKPQKQNSQIKKKHGVVGQSGQKQPSETPSANSKKPFDRLWSEDDEMVIIKGMIEYRGKNKIHPKTDLDGFFEFIKNSISVDVTKTQLHNKIRTLKRKYDNCIKKVYLRNGHEEITFSLLKKIWGNEANGVDPSSSRLAVKRSRGDDDALKESRDNAVKESRDDALKNAVKERRDDEVMVQRPAKRSRPNKENPWGSFMMFDFGDLRDESWIEKVVMPTLEAEKRREIEEKYKELKRQELEINVKKMELYVKQAKLILKASSE